MGPSNAVVREVCINAFSKHMRQSFVLYTDCSVILCDLLVAHFNLALEGFLLRLLLSSHLLLIMNVTTDSLLSLGMNCFECVLHPGTNGLATDLYVPEELHSAHVARLTSTMESIFPPYSEGTFTVFTH